MLTHFKFNKLGNHNYGWLNARYHFNFANYYNPKITQKNPLVVWNDDTIQPQTGFPMHSHQNMEIITYIRQGSITHKDNIGNVGEIKSGQIQVMSAGSGITHSEYNLSNEQTLLFQIWIEPNQYNVNPRWENINLKNNSQESIEVLASGEEKYKNSDIPKIYQDASVIRINGSQGLLNYKSSKNRHFYFVLYKGKILLDKTEINERDGVYINGINEINFEFKKTSELILIDIPINK
jgi:redox-sensitive bicupin YhaK (pirin superfamily)